jgi:hypothetical protein
MKNAIMGLIGLWSISAMLVVTQAEARGIRTDANPSNNWLPCVAGNPCATLPPGLEFNAFGSNPTGSGPTPTVTGGPFLSPGDQSGFGTDAQTPCVTLSCSDSSVDWSSTVPGVAYAASTGTVQSQVVFFNLSNNPTQFVYGPVTSLDSSGNPIPLGTASTGLSAWEIEFNYNAGFVPSSASLEFGGNIYTASASVLSPSNLNEFVDYNGTLHAPPGWVESPASISAPEIDPTSAFAGFTLLAGILAVLRGRRIPVRTRTVD